MINVYIKKDKVNLKKKSMYTNININIFINCIYNIFKNLIYSIKSNNHFKWGCKI